MMTWFIIGILQYSCTCIIAILFWSEAISLVWGSVSSILLFKCSMVFKWYEPSNLVKPPFLSFLGIILYSPTGKTFNCCEPLLISLEKNAAWEHKWQVWLYTYSLKLSTNNPQSSNACFYCLQCNFTFQAAFF